MRIIGFTTNKYLGGIHFTGGTLHTDTLRLSVILTAHLL